MLPFSQKKSGNSTNNLDVWTPSLLALMTVVGMIAGMKLKNEPLIQVASKKTESKDASQDIIGQGRMEEILRYIDAKYVDDVNDNVMIDKSINNLLQELDPHSIYIPVEDLKYVNEDLDGEFDGIGIDALYIDDTLVVVSPIQNGPAAVAGIHPHDKILAIDDSTAIGKDMRWVNKKLRGKKGSSVKIKVVTEPDLPRDLTIARDKIPVHSVEASVQLDEKTGYIKVTRFSNNTTREFIGALDKLVEKKALKNLVIDLRQNPGGYLDKAVDLLSQIFMDKEKLLVFTKGRTVHRNEYKTSGRNRYDIGKVAILIDEGSASASEIVAGAVQDWDRGVIVGRRSFGKGLVQEPYQLRDGSELRLTVARYFTPTGRSIQKPYKNKTKKEYLEEDEKRFEKGELTKDESITQTDTARFFTASGRIVFGGGGIRPDYFVPIDPAYKNEYYNQLKIWIPEYAYRFFTRNKKDVEFGDWQAYQRIFRISDNTFNDFIRYTERQGVKRMPSQIAYIKDLVKKQLKARIARLNYGDDAYFGILNDYDPCVQQALDVLKLNDPLGLRKIVRK